jgi:CubicO group peptidase (beta-lactamase class C family)
MIRTSSMLALAAALALPVHAQTVPATPDEEALVGLWSFQTTFAAEPGRFRGRPIEGARALAGFWIRPAVTADPRHPAGSSQPFATPIVLAQRGRGTWSADVPALADRFTLYLKVFRGEDGALLAAFRNPDQNSTGGAQQFRVSRAGNALRFGAGGTPGQPEVELKGTLIDATTLQVQWPDLERAIDLRRREPSEVPAFFPRPPTDPPYEYRKPPQLKDGWQTARSRDVGIDEAALTRLVRRLASADPAARRPSLIHSLLVAHRGRLVLEEYFFGHDRDQVHDTRSAAKTFSSVLLGAAQRRGHRIGPESRIFELMDYRAPFANPDPRKARITLAHLLTHTAGLACDDNDDRSPGNEGTMQSQADQPDWWKYTLDLPTAHEPGTHYAYCSANINLVGGALTAATRTWLPELFDQLVARPLQFGRYHWNLQPTEEGYLGGGVFLRPRDLLKLGQAYLDGGVWHGRRIVEAAWVRESTSPRIQISPATTGLTEEQFGEFYAEGDDAYAWHLGRVRSGERTFASYAATGNGGQILLVVPELGLTVVFTGGNYGQGGIWTRWVDEIVGAEIVPAMKRAATGPSRAP